VRFRPLVVRGVVSLTMAGSLLAIAQPTAADHITDHIRQDQGQLAQAKSEIALLKREIAAAQNQEAALSAIITGLNVQIAVTEVEVAAATLRLSGIGVALATAQSRLEAARLVLGGDEHQLSEVVVVIYELQNQSTPLDNLLTSGSFNEFWTDVIDSRRVSARELAAVNQVTSERNAVQGDVSRIRTEQRRQADLLSQLYTSEQTLDDQRSARTVAVAYLASLQAQDEHMAAEWEAAENTLDSQIAELQREEKAALAAGGGSGHFIWPDTGPISQGFGCTPYPFEPYDPSCRQKHFHNGLDIAGACGHQIIAADAGIAHIEPFMGNGFGNYIIIVHGNGWQTLYGHLAGFAIRNGQIVARGQLIGYEGTTGNSTGCHLHFGVNRNGQWVNPLAYLT